MTSVTAPASSGLGRPYLNILAIAAMASLIVIAMVMPVAAFGLLALAVGGFVIWRMPWLFVPLMIGSVFFGAVTVGGFGVARLIGPISLPVAVIAVARNGGLTVKGTSMPVWIAGFCLIAVASMFWTDSPGGTNGMLFSLALAIIYAVAIVALVQDRRALRVAMRSIPIASIALFAYTLFALGVSSGDPLMAQEFTGDRNFLAMFLATGAAVSVPIIFHPYYSWDRKMAITGAATGAIGVYLTDSQGGMLALIAMGVVATLLAPRPQTRRKLLPYYVIAAPILAAVIVIVLSSGSNIEGSSGGVIEGIRNSSVDRTNLWRGAYAAWEANPELGVGYGAYADASAQWMLETPGVNLQLYNLPDHSQEAHNTYVELLAELGPAGLTLFMGIVISALLAQARVLRSARSRGDNEFEKTALGLTLAIVAVGVASFFLSVSTNRVWWVVFALTIVLATLDQLERPGRSSGSERSRVNAEDDLTL